MLPLTTQSVPAATLLAFFAGPTIRNDRVLGELLSRADTIEHATLNVFDFSCRTTLHVSDRITGLCGYPASRALEGGITFILDTTDPSDLPYMQLLQAGYVQEARSPGFNPCSIRFHDYYWSMIRSDNTTVPVVSTGVILTYSQHGDLGTGISFHVRNDRDSDVTISGCKELLKQIKQRHNEIYQHPERRETPGPYARHYVNVSNPLITQRERQVLGLMAQGSSTAGIAVALRIAVNTVESHRKKLLLKFEAKNTAELIKKASREFWLA